MVKTVSGTKESYGSRINKTETRNMNIRIKKTKNLTIKLSDVAEEKQDAYLKYFRTEVLLLKRINMHINKTGRIP